MREKRLKHLPDLVEIPNQIKLQFFRFNNKRVLVLKSQDNLNSLYVYLPIGIFPKYFAAYNWCFLIMRETTYDYVYDSFYNLFLDCIRRIQKPLTKKLIIKGLGLKAKAFRNIRILELKLGFSYPIKVSVPKEIFFFRVIKNTVFIQGFDASKLGSFLYQIRLLKFPNIYKGKGFWYKNEKITFKPIKK